MSKDPVLHKILTALLLLGLLPVELFCFWGAWGGYTRDVDDFLTLSILHWPLVPLLWLMMLRLRKHRTTALSVPILLLAICEGVMFMFLFSAMLGAHEIVRGLVGNAEGAVLSARLCLAFAMLAQVFKLWTLVRAAAWVTVWPKANEETVT